MCVGCERSHHPNASGAYRTVVLPEETSMFGRKDPTSATGASAEGFSSRKIPCPGDRILKSPEWLTCRSKDHVWGGRVVQSLHFRLC